MLGEAAILDPDHVTSDPCDGAALTREAAMENHIVALRQAARSPLELVAKHRQAADGCFLCHLVLDDVPVLG